MHARKNISNLFEIEDVRFDLTRKFSLEELFNIGKDFESKMEVEFLKKNTSDWIDYLRSHDIPCEPMQFTEEILENKQAIDNGYVIELNHGTGSKVKSSGPVFNVSTGNAKLTSAPLLGENTSEILHSIGYKAEKIKELLSKGIIGKNL